MLAIIPSATLHGLDGRFIRVEVDVAPGLPGFTIVGLADTALQEARERVRGAIRNAGFSYPPRRITVNLAPADLRKGGASLDLAMALGILLGSEQVRAGPGRLAFIGELSLGGEVRSGAGCPADGRGARAARPQARRGRRARRRRGAAHRGRRGVRRGDASSGGRADPDRPCAATGAIPAADRAGRRRDEADRRRRGRGCRASRRAPAAGPQRGPRPARRPARARDRARRRAWAAAHRPARVGQDAPGPDDPEPAPAARRCGGARRNGRRVGRRRGSHRRAPASTAVSLTAPHGVLCRDGRRRPAPVARRDHAGGSGRPVPR